MSNEKSTLGNALTKLTNVEFKTILAYVVLMVGMGTFAFVFLFEINGIKEKSFANINIARAWSIGSFLIGILNIVGMFLVTLVFVIRVLFKPEKIPSDTYVLERLLSTIQLPVIISDKLELNILLSNESARQFYGKELIYEKRTHAMW